MTFLKKPPACDAVAYADVNDHFFGKEASHASNRLLLAGDSSDIFSFQTVPSESSQQDQDPLFYIGSQSGDIPPARKGASTQNAQR